MVQFPAALGAHTDDLKVRVTPPNKVKWTRVAANKELLTIFNIHGTVHRSMTSSNNQRDAA